MEKISKRIFVGIYFLLVAIFLSVIGSNEDYGTFLIVGIAVAVIGSVVFFRGLFRKSRRRQKISD